MVYTQIELDDAFANMGHKESLRFGTQRATENHREPQRFFLLMVSRSVMFIIKKTDHYIKAIILHLVMLSDFCTDRIINRSVALCGSLWLSVSKISVTFMVIGSYFNDVYYKKVDHYIKSIILHLVKFSDFLTHRTKKRSVALCGSLWLSVSHNSEICLVINSRISDVYDNSRMLRSSFSYPHDTSISSLKDEDITLKEWIRNGAKKINIDDDIY